MKIITLPVSDLHPADYNPRKDLAPGDKQYDKLARSIETFGYVEPIVWNRTTGNIVGGHQRLKVLVEQGYKTVEVVEVELNEQEERILNVSLNKISGRWDNEKLTAILDELKEQDEMALTGFEDWELDALKVTYDHIEDLLNEDFSDTGKSEPTSYTMTFTLPEEVHEAMDKYIDENPAGQGRTGAVAREQGEGAYLMEIIKKRITDMERAEYNPRVELMPGDDEYEKLKRNIERFGMVVPVIWNRRTNRVVSGHQRLTVLMNEGVTEVDVSVVDLDETAEKQLNIAMNKVTGEWDEVKLKELLDGLGDAAPETGFDLYEIEALENNVDALVDGDFLDSELKSIEETFNISLKFSAEDRDVLKEYIKDNGKEDLVAVIVQKIRGEI